MKHWIKPVLLAFLVVTFIVLVLRCDTKGATISISNNSKGTLSNIILSGRRFTHAIDKLDKGKTISVQVFPKGESDLVVQFDAEGKRYNQPQNSYFEGHGYYRLFVEVKDDLAVTTDVRITQR